MTPEQKIKRHILQEIAKVDESIPGIIDGENLDELWEIHIEDSDSKCDFVNEFRESGEDTNLDPPYSRHYESRQVARQLDDGTWVAWTYWYGGGKHACPEDVDWIRGAFEVEVRQETRVVNVFAKKEAAR